MHTALKKQKTNPPQKLRGTIEKSCTENKFDETKARNVEAAKRNVENYESSSEEEELNGGEILEKLYQNYNDVDHNLLSKTTGFLENTLQTGSAVCLICIGTIKRSDAIWSCKYCFCSFHLICIKRWANDSIALLKDQKSQHDLQGYYNSLGEYIHKKVKSIKWCCPQCRRDYTPDDRPKQYECFCGKEIDPPNQPWFLPHSCGENCEKNLQPKCGHKCLLLCHPGPCPPCPQSVFNTCKCGKSNKQLVRCFQKTWTCSNKCDSLLSCLKHKCNKICHESDRCPPCSKTSIQKCVCGNEEKVRSCSQLIWQCKKVCNLKYSCGIHNCTKNCHLGPCGDCPLGLPRFCPCGKTKRIVACTEAIDTCGDTCQKILSCGLHYCIQRCHKGGCSLCPLTTKKKCRCGLHEKELPCWKDFTCETKCKQIKDCGKHLCNKKCCDGQCGQCDKVCGKILSCKKHKCKSICHEGPCYPCDLKSQVNCSCGCTSISVPCGRERKARPVCKQPCRIPSKCHHQNGHRCHKKECPPCDQKCGLPNTSTGCQHICEARCHAAVKQAMQCLSKTSTLYSSLKKFEFKALPHPHCEKKVSISCIGGHVIAMRPCWNSKPSSCQGSCNRLVSCGNHTCKLPCHFVPDPTDMKAQEGCEICEERCSLARPVGCVHSCQSICHLPPCQPCLVIVKSKCHCELSLVYYKCSEYNDNTNPADKAKQIEKLKSCGNRCIKTYDCGHRCTEICHSGSCPNSKTCRKKVRIYCECKSLKAEISCEKHRIGMDSLQCNNSCLLKKQSNENFKRDKWEKLKFLEEERNRIELEQFEKKFLKKKHKERKVVIDNTKAKQNWKNILITLTVVVAIIAAFIVALYE